MPSFISIGATDCAEFTAPIIPLGRAFWHTLSRTAAKLAAKAYLKAADMFKVHIAKSEKMHFLSPSDWKNAKGK